MRQDVGEDDDAKLSRSPSLEVAAERRVNAERRKKVDMRQPGTRIGLLYRKS